MLENLLENTVSGIVSVVGSGGKTTLVSRLAQSLPGTVVLTTTTHVLPFADVPLLVDPSLPQLAEKLGRARVVCVGTRAEGGKLTAPQLTCAQLAEVAHWVLVEADGSRRLPLKAHAPWEPVVPEGTQKTILVVGASGLGRPVREAAHRPELFCAAAGCDAEDAATPELVARVLLAERPHTRFDQVVVNQAEEPGRMEAARRLADALGLPVWAGSVRAGSLDLLAPR